MGNIFKMLSMKQKDKLVFVLSSLANEFTTLADEEKEFFMETLVSEFSEKGIKIRWVKTNG